MFTFYLLGLCFWPPWREQCNRPATYMVFIEIYNCMKYHSSLLYRYFKICVYFAFL